MTKKRLIVLKLINWIHIGHCSKYICYKCYVYFDWDKYKTLRNKKKLLLIAINLLTWAYIRPYNKYIIWCRHNTRVNIIKFISDYTINWIEIVNSNIYPQ